MLGCIIQARMGSTRLPKKVMKKLDNKNTVLDYVLNQIKTVKLIDKIIVATTIHLEDNSIEEYVQKLGFETFRGSSQDVLDRYYQCSKKYKFSAIIRITSDCPLIDPEIINKVIKKFKQNKFDYVSNTHPRTFPQGTEIEIFSFQALKNAWENAKLPSEREHVTPFFYNNPKKFKISNVENKKNLSMYRWCLDYKDDLIVIKTIVSKISSRPIYTKDILKIIKSNPQLFDINKNFFALDGYVKSLEDDKKFLSRRNK